MADPKVQQAAQSERRHIWDDPKNVQKLLVVFWVSCGVILALDFFFVRHLSFDHDELPIEGWFGFYGFYGLLACVALVLIAKQLRRVLMRGEDYYDR